MKKKKNTKNDLCVNYVPKTTTQKVVYDDNILLLLLCIVPFWFRELLMQSFMTVLQNLRLRIVHNI